MKKEILCDTYVLMCLYAYMNCNIWFLSVLCAIFESLMTKLTSIFVVVFKHCDVALFLDLPFDIFFLNHTYLYIYLFVSYDYNCINIYIYIYIYLKNQSWLGSLINTIVGNLKLSISNIHIRYEVSERCVIAS